MLEVRPAPKSNGVLLRAWRTLKRSPRIACAGSLVCGGWSAIHAAQLAASATVVGTFAVPMAIGALLGVIGFGFTEFAAERPKADVDWVERIRISVLTICVYAPLLQYLRKQQVASTWFAFAGGALVMYSLVLMLQLLKGPSRLAVERVESDTGHAGSA
ncbi:MAG: hypothetical protein ACK5U0_15125 [Gemmatimonas sp.]|jgi:hypothetical protein|uniref:hypothetical protein n=1 Tax=Gemmatimonas sp. TaxID=1962908 RepID=UPI0022BED24A|nr:hypothetical protein [Gemmatimonas sp.]MCE2902981.1 hypothetical protein [Gemmatimonadota bacterium]MCZ8012727.1 hypothetical protein [Gemmatimonas sp.]MCZ8268683.1 hypothetical protein [Gemmatimonas sp.]